MSKQIDKLRETNRQLRRDLDHALKKLEDREKQNWELRQIRDAERDRAARSSWDRIQKLHWEEV